MPEWHEPCFLLFQGGFMEKKKILSGAVLTVALCGLMMAGCSGGAEKAVPSGDKADASGIEEVIVPQEPESPKNDVATDGEVDEVIDPQNPKAPPAADVPAEEPPIYHFIPITVTPIILPHIEFPDSDVKNVNVHWEESSGSILLAFDAVSNNGTSLRVWSEPGKDAPCKEASTPETVDAFTSRHTLRCEPKKKNSYIIAMVTGSGVLAAQSKVSLNFGTPAVTLQKAAVSEPMFPGDGQQNLKMPWSATVPFELTIDGSILKGSFVTRTAFRSVRLQHYDLGSGLVTDWEVSHYAKATIDTTASQERYLFQISAAELDGGTWQFSNPVVYKYRVQFKVNSFCSPGGVQMILEGVRAFHFDCGQADYDLKLYQPNGPGIGIPTRDSADWNVSHGLLGKVDYYSLYFTNVDNAQCNVTYEKYDGTRETVPAFIGCDAANVQQLAP